MRQCFTEAVAEGKRALMYPRMMTVVRLMALALLLACGLAQPASAQVQAQAPAQAQLRNPATLAVEGPVLPGETVEVAIAFAPREGWHGYWFNPGDAGKGMELRWDLPPGWRAGEPRYPVPETLFAFGFMNHVYKSPYAVLVPLTVPAGAAEGPTLIGVRAEYLACSDSLCVRETAELVGNVVVGADGRRDPRFARWEAKIPPRIDAKARVEREGETLRIAIPLPQTQALGRPHVFIAEDGLVQYGEQQAFYRGEDRLVAVLAAKGDANPRSLSGVLRFGNSGRGIAFTAERGPVGLGSTTPLVASNAPSIGWLFLAAFVGGIVLNILPCVFPILSLKALHLARAGESESAARRDALAYTGGVMVAVLGLGALLLALRAGGEQVGWAFQLQQPGIVLALLVLVTAITANLAGVFELPTLAGRRQASGSFATGLLAAFIATPCTGPFMAAALGAALILPTQYALGLFAALGLGFALPFLLLGFVPALRSRLPRPGGWMAHFRRWMALPMGVTALALLWLAVRIGGWPFAAIGLAIALVVIAMLMGAGRRQRGGKPVGGGMIAGGLAVVLALAVVAPRWIDEVEADAGVLDPADFSEATLAQAKATGRPVFLWFTADWCLTCKVNEKVAIEREATRDAFADAGVIAIRGDWTRSNPAITRYLESKGAAGIPLYVWIDRDGEEQVLPQVLGPDSLIDLAGASPKNPARGTPQ